MIVRILGEGQYEVGEGDVSNLSALDEVVDRALADGDEAAFARALAELTEAVRRVGQLLDASEILPSDLVLPHEGASLAEVHALIESESAES